jgi:hypothetical protein
MQLLLPPPPQQQQEQGRETSSYCLPRYKQHMTQGMPHFLAKACQQLVLLLLLLLQTWHQLLAATVTGQRLRRKV